MAPAPTSAAGPEASEAGPAGADGVRLPAAALRRLSRLLGEPGGGGVPALREAGRTAGRRMVRELGGDGAAADRPLPAFWRELRDAAGERGWGHAAYGVLSGAVGEVTLRGSPEADGGAAPDADARSRRAGCHFAVGWIGGALSEAAGEPVTVLEVECRGGRDATACRFLVGREARLREILASLRAGASVEEALEER